MGGAWAQASSRVHRGGGESAYGWGERARWRAVVEFSGVRWWIGCGSRFVGDGGEGAPGFLALGAQSNARLPMISLTASFLIQINCLVRGFEP